jgi:hypothetical protein
MLMRKDIATARTGKWKTAGPISRGVITAEWAWWMRLTVCSTVSKMTWDSVGRYLWMGEVNEENCERNVQDSDERCLEIVDDIVQ